MEVYEEPNLTKEIIGGVVAGLILLALMTAGLAKVTNEQYEIMQLFDFTSIFTLSFFHAIYSICLLSFLSFIFVFQFQSGFFKSQYQQKLEEAGAEAQGEEEPPEAVAE